MGFDAYVTQVMKAFEVPGLAVTVVKDGAVVLAKGYGVKKLGDPAPVDAQTRFGIASNTKVFTATALGVLVEEGKIEWDAPVVRYLPGFQMWDPWVTRELTVRDLLVHRSGLGLGAGDLLWWPPSTYDRKEIARRLRFLKPVASFRTAYAYDNVLYLVAGQVIEAVSGQSWEDFMTTRILAKVGMSGSNVTHSGALGGGNVAAPHARIDGVVRPVAPFAQRQHEPRRRNQLERPGHGPVAPRAAGRRPPPRRLASLLRRHLHEPRLHRHPHPDLESARGAGRHAAPVPGLRPGSRHQ